MEKPKKPPKKCVRLECRECETFHDFITQAALEKLKQQGWTDVSEVQSYEDSIKTYDNPADAPPGFSALDRWTHLGYCPECSKEIAKDEQIAELKAENAKLKEERNEAEQDYDDLIYLCEQLAVAHDEYKRPDYTVAKIEALAAAIDAIRAHVSPTPNKKD